LATTKTPLQRNQCEPMNIFTHRVTVGLMLVAGCGSKASDTASNKTAAPGVKVALTAAVEASTPEILTVTGLVAAEQRTDVSPDTAGKVLQVMVERGQKVKQGAPLVRLDTRNAQLGATEARANLAAVRAQRQLAEDECKRSEQLLGKGAITQSQYDRERTSCTAALQQVAAAEARTQMITKSISDGIVRAPFDGEVTQKMASPGMWVGPGVPLVTLVDADPLHVDLAVPEGAFAHLKQGQAVDVEATAFAGQVFKAKITRLGGEVGRMNRAITVEAQLDPGSPLLAGMFAESRIVVGEKKLPVIPASAAVQRSKTWRVFVAVNGQLEERVVQLGPAPSATEISIRAGLAVGEKVATTITPQIVDGLKLIP
jgi:RND family efflux transporter MFP subunit